MTYTNRGRAVTNLELGLRARMTCLVTAHVHFSHSSPLCRSLPSSIHPNSQNGECSFTTSSPTRSARRELTCFCDRRPQHRPVARSKRRSGPRARVRNHHPHQHLHHQHLHRHPHSINCEQRPRLLPDSDKRGRNCLPSMNRTKQYDYSGRVD